MKKPLLLLLSVLASKASGRLGVPSLLIFIGIGMLAGSEGPGRIAFSDFPAAQNVGVVALAYILFAGGLDTEWKSVQLPCLASQAHRVSPRPHPLPVLS